MTSSTRATLFVVSLLVCSILTSAEVRFNACTYSDAECTAEERCESETTGDCADTGVAGIEEGDVGIRVTCAKDLSKKHNVSYSTDDDCEGGSSPTQRKNNECFEGTRTLFNKKIYVKIECFESAVCFSRDSTVLLESGDRKMLSHVVVGDSVQSVDDAGNSVFSEVFLTQHGSEALEVPMLNIEVADSSRKLIVTHDHYLRASGSAEKYVKASSVSVGDALFVMSDGEGSVMKETTVSAISYDRGTPRNVHTMNDRIVVDGIVASCVSSNQVFGLDTMQVRYLLAPLKMMHSLGLRRVVAAVDRAVHLAYTTANKL